MKFIRQKYVEGLTGTDKCPESNLSKIRLDHKEGIETTETTSNVSAVSTQSLTSRGRFLKSVYVKEIHLRIILNSKNISELYLLQNIRHF